MNTVRFSPHCGSGVFHTQRASCFTLKIVLEMKDPKAKKTTRSEEEQMIRAYQRESDRTFAWLYHIEQFIRYHYGSHVIEHIKTLGRAEIPRILQEVLPTELGEDLRERWIGA